MFTPIGFFAEEAGGLPAVVQSFDIFYSADQTTTWTDQTANGNNGTVTAFGSGGTSAVTHVGGATPYWDFTAPNPTSEQSYVETNVAPGALSNNTPFSIFVVFQDPDLTTNCTLFSSFDSSGDQIQMGTSRSGGKVFANLRGSSSSQIISTTILSNNTWYMAIVTYDGAFSNYQLTLNNQPRGDAGAVSLDVSQTIKVGRPILSSTNVGNQKVAAWGWANGYELSGTDRTDLFNYYDAIYSFPSV